MERAWKSLGIQWDHEAPRWSHGEEQESTQHHELGQNGLLTADHVQRQLERILSCPGGIERLDQEPDSGLVGKKAVVCGEERKEGQRLRWKHGYEVKLGSSLGSHRALEKCTVRVTASLSASMIPR